MSSSSLKITSRTLFKVKIQNKIRCAQFRKIKGMTLQKDAFSDDAWRCRSYWSYCCIKFEYNYYRTYHWMVCSNFDHHHYWHHYRHTDWLTASARLLSDTVLHAAYSTSAFHRLQTWLQNINQGSHWGNETWANKIIDDTEQKTEETIKDTL